METHHEVNDTAIAASGMIQGQQHKEEEHDQQRTKIAIR
jgi:hypothetical protein